jgi:hypothetical protein
MRTSLFLIPILSLCAGACAPARAEAGPFPIATAAAQAGPPVAAGSASGRAAGSEAGPMSQAGALAPASLPFPGSNRADANRPVILDAWKRRVDRNHGVHAWNRDNDGMRVFQEWIALLTLAQGRGPQERERMGLALQRYVVGGNIGPLGFVGTSIPVPGYDQGDFDMSLLNCASLLGLFEDDRTLLTDTTFLHLIKRVARVWGQRPKGHFEVGFVSMPETENHLFMTESTRFLINQMIAGNRRGLPALAALRDSLQGAGVELDNGQGPLKRLLLRNMQQALRKGFFEFNAQIYQRFTLHALDNLYSFSRDPAVSEGAACLLDYLSAVFAFQSFGSVRYGPYRRSSEVYGDSSLIGNDAVCSFFALQSGAFGPSAAGFWRIRNSHAHMALFSAVLKYRVPAPILAYMQGRPAEYRAEIRSAYAGRGMRRRPTEAYSGGPDWLLTAGGRYESYAGPNFPTLRFWFNDAPWVYDVITRPGSLLLDPARERPRELKDILHFRGAQWRANNMAIHRNFLYGYAPAARYNPPDWPQHVPAGWKWDGRTYATRDFDFRFFDRSDRGVYVVLSRLRPLETWLRWGYQRYMRGGIEVVDTADVGSLQALRDSTLARNAAKAHWPLGPHRYTYVDFSGARLGLNARYDGTRDGIVRVQEPPADTAASAAPDVVPPFPVAGADAPTASAGFLPRRASRPLFQVETYRPWRGKVAEADGEGGLWLYHPGTGGYCLADFREWWNPRRIVKE